MYTRGKNKEEKKKKMKTFIMFTELKNKTKGKLHIFREVKLNLRVCFHSDSLSMCGGRIM